MKHFRYQVRVRFKVIQLDNGVSLVSQSLGIDEPVKSLREAKEYQSMVDDSVSEAYVYDNVSKTIAERWK